MAEETPSLHIDTDWKKQAQEEKRRLAEQQEQRAAAAQSHPPAAPSGAAPMAGAARAGGPARRGKREVPAASFSALVQSQMTQVLLYLGELAPQGSEPMLNLDMAKYQLDLMSILEDKTKNNLAPDEQHMLDAALYDLRTRFIHVAQEYI
ncbi:MAG TPA: DUF1844 domain-containing protein [Tepidisphaeraceae bacterium]|nr:DUF1844 domain-containing protein [Tepidisphaeraceae bacterium]